MAKKPVVTGSQASAEIGQGLASQQWGGGWDGGLYAAFTPRNYASLISDAGWQGVLGPTQLATLQLMADTDETVGAMQFLVEAVLSQNPWSHTACVDGAPDDTNPKALAAKQFADSLLVDMVTPWSDHLSDALTMLTMGFAPCEIVTRQRLPENGSRFSDGFYGFKRLALRAQTSISQWVYDGPDLVALKQFGGGETAEWKFINYRMRAIMENPTGRALDPETPIPTPDGWRRMDDLVPGSKVFDEEGRVRYVVARADWNDRPCYQIRFSDGHEIIADANHQWLASNRAQRNHRRPAQLVTTAQMAEKVRCKDGIVNYAVGWAEPLDYAEQSLPLDPYFLGLWLGDGSKGSSQIACHADDLEETAALIDGCGYATKIVRAPEGSGGHINVHGQTLWDRTGPQSRLRIMGLINNKHVPDAYLRGSYGQRLALLSGLMDSDGHVTTTGACEFDNTNYALASAVAELVRSLGVSPYIRSRRNSHGNLTWRVGFTPTFVPFRLGRKAIRCKANRVGKYHYIDSIEPVESRRTVCIQVDSPSHLFLAGQGMVPTHNSLLLNARRAWELKRRIQDSEAIGIDRDLAGIPRFKMPQEDLDVANQTDASGKFTKEAMAAQARINTAMRAVSTMRMNPSNGLILPSDTFASDEPETKDRTPKYDFGIVTAAGPRTIPTREAVRDYDMSIARVWLMQFIQLGTKGGGSYGLSADQSDVGFSSITAIGNKICEGYQKALNLIFQINGKNLKYVPKLSPGAISKEGLQALGAFLNGVGRSVELWQHDAETRMSIVEAAGLRGDRASQQKAVDLLATTMANASDAASNLRSPNAQPGPGGAEA